jgi:hypothetical protein
LDKSSFSQCNSLASVTFESGPQFGRVNDDIFSWGRRSFLAFLRDLGQK